jgi:hypothetical protein
MLSQHGPCPSCCPRCSYIPVSPPAPTSLPGTDSPYALVNFLPAGTVQIPISPHHSCNNEHAGDGWHSFNKESLLPHVISSEDESFVQQLDFLVKHKFVSATCRLNGARNSLFLRIYIIPYDLANVHGALRVRDKAKVVAPARQFMKALLPRILQGRLQWEGIESETSTDSRPFLPQDIVSVAVLFACGRLIDLLNRTTGDYPKYTATFFLRPSFLSKCQRA